MARCNIQGFDELLSTMEGLLEADNIASEMLVEGADVLRDNIRAGITEAANRGYATGELASSVVPTAPAKNRYGHYVFVRPVGTDSKGVRNGEKWGYLERGNGGTQEPHPFADKVISKSEKECTEKMQEVFNRHVK